MPWPSSTTRHCTGPRRYRQIGRREVLVGLPRDEVEGFLHARAYLAGGSIGCPRRLWAGEGLLSSALGGCWDGMRCSDTGA